MSPAVCCGDHAFFYLAKRGYFICRYIVRRRILIPGTGARTAPNGPNLIMTRNAYRAGNDRKPGNCVVSARQGKREVAAGHRVITPGIYVR